MGSSIGGPLAVHPGPAALAEYLNGWQPVGEAAGLASSPSLPVSSVAVIMKNFSSAMTGLDRRLPTLLGAEP